MALPTPERPGWSGPDATMRGVPFEKEIEAAKSIAIESAHLALKYQKDGVSAESKLDLSPVTLADKECEKLITQRLLETFPDDGVLGEEGAAFEGKSGRRWIIDPIDGTRDFVRGAPLWAVLIGLEVDGEVAAGVSYLAGRSEMYTAIQGEGAWCNGQRVRVSAIDSPGNAVVCYNGLNRIPDQSFAAELPAWLAQFWAVRSMGGCVDAMMVASGQADVWIEPVAQAWDLAPIKVILEEAGARFLNFDGGGSIYGGNCGACVPALEPALRRLLGLQ